MLQSSKSYRKYFFCCCCRCDLLVVFLIHSSFECFFESNSIEDNLKQQLVVLLPASSTNSAITKIVHIEGVLCVCNVCVCIRTHVSKCECGWCVHACIVCVCGVFCVCVHACGDNLDSKLSIASGLTSIT